MTDKIEKFDDVNELERDMLKELGSIGTGNAATSLSSMLNTNVLINLPEVKIANFSDAIYTLGDPEEAVIAVFSEFQGEFDGIMMFILRMDFANNITKSMMNKEADDYSQLDEISLSAITEVGNILMSSYVNSLASFTNFDIKMSTPAVSINMLGGLLNVAMVEVGYEADKLLLVKGQFKVGEIEHNASLLLVPSIPSLNNLMKKLGL